MSTIQLSPFINFQGRAYEAMEFYQRCWAGSWTCRLVPEIGSGRRGSRLRGGHYRLGWPSRLSGQGW
jgi:hypothetical protein